MEVDRATTPTGDAPAAAEAVHTATAASGARARKARGSLWTDGHSRALTAGVLAARSAGGACVRVVLADGSAVEVEVKHSKESIPALVEANEKIRLAAAAAEGRRQQRWIEQVEAAAPSGSPAPPPERPTKSMRKRAARRAKIEKQAAQLRLLEEAKAVADDQREERLQGLMRQALERISQLASAAATSAKARIVARRAVLEQGGEPLPVAVLAGTAGAAYSDEEFGDKLRKALDGLPAERLSTALETLLRDDLMRSDEFDLFD